jgi:hypothetical protein
VRWLADECIAAALVAFPRTRGHDVLYVAEVAAGLSDADVIALALQEKRLRTRISAILCFGANAQFRA